MDKLEEKHFSVIEHEFFYDERKFEIRTRLSKESAEITKDIAIEFLRWSVSNPLMSNTSSMSKETAEYFFDEFLKTIK